MSEIVYDLDPYDRVRMQLIFEDKKLYTAYMNTKSALEDNIKFQPRKRTMPFYLDCPIMLGELIIMLTIIYIFFLII